MFDLTPEEQRIFNRLNTPKKIQDFIHKIPINFEKNGETMLSPRQVLKQNRAHCMEGALLAAAILWYHGKPAELLDLRSVEPDYDHVVTLFKVNGLYGSISKTNHAVLNYRDPVYKSVRELAMTFFHEYFLNNGKKTLRDYLVFDLKKLGTDWVTSDKNLFYIAEEIDKHKHEPILNKKITKLLRPADDIQIKAGKLVKFKKLK